MTYLLIFFTSLIFSIFFTPYLIMFLERKGVVDKPGERRINKKIVPRMGGLIIFAVVLIELLAFYNDLNGIRLLIISAIFIAVLGIIDDIDELKWYVKFGVQFIVAALIILYFRDKIENIELFGWILPEYLNYSVLFFFIVGVINSINLMDGLDGLVGGFALLIFFIIMSLAFLSNNTLLLLLTAALMGSLLGFLKFNAYPAKIFLGDTGSLLLGYFLVITSMLTILEYKPGSMDLSFPIILLGVPILDTLKVMTMRILNKRNPFLPDKNHLHHIIFGSPVKHKTTVFIIHFYTLIFTTLSLYYVTTFSKYTFLVFALFMFSMLLVKPFMRFIKSVSEFKLYFEKLLNFHYYLLKAYNKSLIWLSAIAVVGIVITTFPVSIGLNREYISYMALFGVYLFLISFYNYKKLGIVSNIYVYINLTFFFLFYNLNKEKLSPDSFHSIVNNPYLFYGSFIILSFIVLFFLVARERILPKSKIFLTGLDLLLIVIISLSFLLQNFLNENYLYILSRSMVMSFIMYLWFRVVVTLREKIYETVYYSTFALPLITIFYMIMFKQ